MAGQDRIQISNSKNTIRVAADRRVRTAVRTDENIPCYDSLREDLGPLHRTHAEPGEIVLTLFVHTYEDEMEKEKERSAT